MIAFYLLMATDVTENVSWMVCTSEYVEPRLYMMIFPM